VSIEKDFQTYEGIAEQVEVLAAQLKGEHFDVMLVITRGGMIPGAILGYRLGLRNILIAAVEFYDDETGARASAPRFLQFPADPLLEGKRVLVVDEVWDSGRTIQAVDARVRMAGGEPITAVLHYKQRNRSQTRLLHQSHERLDRLPVVQARENLSHGLKPFGYVS
jgi:uncharacterized protein